MTSVPVRRPPVRTPPVADLAEHAQAHRAARRSRWLRRAGRGVLLLLPLGALAWVLLGSSWLAVDRVQVVGHARLAPAEVERAAAVVDGTPLARVDTSAVEARVARLAPVDEVRVSRSWPGTLRVELVERTAAAGVLDASGVRLVDAEGVVFGKEPRLPAGVVRLQVAKPGPQDPATAAALEVLASLPPALRARIRTVRAASPSAVELLTLNNKQVLWGSRTGAAGKAAATLALLDKPNARIDVSAPGVVVTR